MKEGLLFTIIGSTKEAPRPQRLPYIVLASNKKDNPTTIELRKEKEVKSKESAFLWRWQYILMLISIIVATISAAAIWYNTISDQSLKSGVVIENNDNRGGAIIVGGKNRTNIKSE